MRTRIDADVSRFIAASVFIDIRGGDNSCMILILADPDKRSFGEIQASVGGIVARKERHERIVRAVADTSCVAVVAADAGNGAVSVYRDGAYAFILSAADASSLGFSFCIT